MVRAKGRLRGNILAFLASAAFVAPMVAATSQSDKETPKVPEGPFYVRVQALDDPMLVEFRGGAMRMGKTVKDLEAAIPGHGYGGIYRTYYWAELPIPDSGEETLSRLLVDKLSFTLVHFGQGASVAKERPVTKVYMSRTWKFLDAQSTRTRRIEWYYHKSTEECIPALTPESAPLLRCAPPERLALKVVPHVYSDRTLAIQVALVDQTGEFVEVEKWVQGYRADPALIENKAVVTIKNAAGKLILSKYFPLTWTTYDGKLRSFN